LIAFVCLGCNLYGQLPGEDVDSPKSEEEEEPVLQTYRVSFYLPPQVGILTDTSIIASAHEVYAFDGTQEHRLLLKPGRRSPPINIVGDGEVLLYTRRERTDPETGETVVDRTPFSRTPMPEGWQRALILISSGREVGGGRRGVPLRADPGHIPNGAVRIMNMAPTTLAFSHGDQAQQIASTGSILISRNQLTEAHRLKFLISERKEGEWEPAFRGSRRLSQEDGNLMILSPRSEHGGIRVFMFNSL